MTTRPPGDHPRLCVMISGSGRSLANLTRLAASGSLRARIALVIASRQCPGLAHAAAHGVHAQVIPGQIPAEELARTLDAHAIDLTVLAGYLRYLHVPASHAGRVINIHPALLPDFGGPGMHGRRVHEAVLAAGRHVSGCTVHVVDDQYDHGPVVLQRACAVLASDTPESLADRVFAQELLALPEAIDALLHARWTPARPPIRPQGDAAFIDPSHTPRGSRS
ncbi:MAG: phosphoribosylglycinamide formyltransferase [Planctomyces sp.]|nr:phosphoribosylglycinamide formyltransferase [Planctomyces sp.]